MKRKRILEITLAGLLLCGLFLLSREGAKLVSSQLSGAKTVIIDAGHGAKDPGKVGVNNVEEKELNLTIALKVEALLKKEGIHVIMTRSNDAPLYSEGAKNRKAEDMQERLKVINDNNPDCVISIHQNSYSQESVKGAQVFYYETSKAGKELGEIMQEKLVAMVDNSNTRQAKGNATYFLLKKAKAPLAIVECGFLSNNKEAELLTTDDYQNLLAEAITAGVLEYVKGK